MNNCLKSALRISALSALTAASVYSFSRISVELLFNRKWVLPRKINSSIVNCDSERLESTVDNNVKWVENYGYEKHCLVNDRGEKLVANLLKPKEESDIFVFGVHGYRGNGKRLGGMAKHYIEKGYNVFLPDLVSSGDSEGTYCTMGTQETKDCLKWLTHMTDTFGKDIKIILHGVSLGAATVMFMSGDEALPENVKMAVEDSGFSSITRLFKYKLERNMIKSDILIKLVNYTNKKKLGFDFYKINPVESVRKTNIPMLFIHGTNDGLVPSFMVHELFDACNNENSQILEIDGANHAQCLMVGGEKYFSVLDSFIDKNI